MIRIGAVGLGVAAVAGWLLSDQNDPNALGGIGVGFLAALIAALVALIPGRRMPDWAIGLGNPARSPRPASSPLVRLGWALTGIAFIGGLIASGLPHAIAAAAIAAVVPAGLVVSLDRFLAGARATQAWAAERVLDWSPEGDVNAATPLLREGDYNYTLNVCSGELAAGLTGSVMHLGSVEVDESSDGGGHTTRRFTVVVTAVADPGKRLPLCICSPRSRIPGYQALDALLKRLRRVDLESIDFERRYELAIDKKTDESWLRRLFEPTFTERMALAGGGRMGWEIESGTLTAYTTGYATSAAELDAVVELARLVADRVNTEAEQTAAV
jgi:hypothetical protein